MATFMTLASLTRSRRYFHFSQPTIDKVALVKICTEVAIVAAQIHLWKQMDVYDSHTFQNGQVVESWYFPILDK